MKKIQNKYEKILNNFSNKNIAIIGDLMLDNYIWGSVARISPEAPVPIINVDKESYQLGGSANVASNIKSLNGNAFVFGVIGKDKNGNKLIELFKKNGINTSGIVIDKERPTTVKTRVIAHQQHVVRIDSEKKNNISTEIENRLLEKLENIINKIDGIILEDYNKGVLTERLIERIVLLANKNKKIITVDPKFSNFFAFKNVTLFKPNTKELEEAFGRKLKSNEEIISVVKELQTKLKSKNILITRGENGMSLFKNGNHVLHLPTKALKVADVSGAGDTVIATITMGLVAGAKVEDAMIIANNAASIVCQEVGAVPIVFSDLLKSFN